MAKRQTIYDAFRSNLVNLLAARGWSQSELARKMGVTPSRINQLVSGHRRPTIGTLEDLATALEVEPADLITQK